MTPEERARVLFSPFDDVVMGDSGGGPHEQAVVAAIHHALAEERERCARFIENLPSAPTCNIGSPDGAPDNPLVRHILTVCAAKLRALP